jgi:hypothetical protein
MQILGKIIGLLVGYTISATVTVYVGLTVLKWLEVALVS